LEKEVTKTNLFTIGGKKEEREFKIAKIKKDYEDKIRDVAND